MKVEVDVSDIPMGSHYRDERCERAEGVLQNDDQFAGFMVKRYRREEDSHKDPYFIMDAEERYWVWMNGWEIDALDDYELFSYISVVKETSYRESPVDKYVIATGLFGAASFLLVLMALIFPDDLLNPLYLPVTIVTFVLFIISGGVMQRKEKEYKQSEKEYLAMMVERRPLYLQALRKFTEIEDISESMKEEYTERLQEVESGLADR